MSGVKRNHSNRKRAFKHKSKPHGNESDVMADVMAQLRRQREKRKTEDAVTSSAVHSSSVTDSNRDVVDAASNDCAPKKSIGKFRYDPVLKRYLPKSAYESNGNNDKCIQRLQKGNRKKMMTIDSTFSRASAAATSYGAPFDYDLRRVLFGGCCLRNHSSTYHYYAAYSLHSAEIKVDQKRKKRSKQSKTKDHTKCVHNLEQQPNIHPCSERSIILLATSLSYCSNTRRRRLVSALGTLYISRALGVVPSVATTHMLIERNKIGCVIPDEEKRQRSTHQTICSHRNSDTESKLAAADSSTKKAGSTITWHSLLTPIIGLDNNQEVTLQRRRMAKPTIPVDCHCKSYLHPTASTFDILSDGSSLPHIVTIIEERMMHYRKPVNAAALEPSSIEMRDRCVEEYAFSIPNKNAIVIEEGFRVAPGKIHAARLAYLPIHSSPRNHNRLYIGCINYDLRYDQSRFILHGLYDPREKETHYYNTVDGGVHDFCFGQNNKPVVALAHTSDRRAAVTILDLDNYRVAECETISDWLNSDPLCVQFRRNQANNQLLLGHRDGTLSNVDIRSTGVQTTSLSRDDFGSVTSIHQLNREHLIIAKGSFGSCQVLDMRQLNKKKSQVLMLQPSPDVHYTKSVNCTGLAVDPFESLVMSPFVSKKNEVKMALWSLDNGNLLRTIKLESEADSNIAGDCPLFCELKSEITGGFRMSCTDESTPTITGNKWGVWYKSRSASSSLPRGAGGIHHISFD